VKAGARRCHRTHVQTLDRRHCDGATGRQTVKRSRDVRSRRLEIGRRDVAVGAAASRVHAFAQARRLADRIKSRRQPPASTAKIQRMQTRIGASGFGPKGARGPRRRERIRGRAMTSRTDRADEDLLAPHKLLIRCALARRLSCSSDPLAGAPIGVRNLFSLTHRAGRRGPRRSSGSPAARA